MWELKEQFRSAAWQKHGPLNDEGDSIFYVLEAKHQ